jgi:hypothetical protein
VPADRFGDRCHQPALPDRDVGLESLAIKTPIVRRPTSSPSSATLVRRPVGVGDGIVSSAVTEGRILGHEAVGTVEEVGASVGGLQSGDRVLVSCWPTSCRQVTRSGS